MFLSLSGLMEYETSAYLVGWPQIRAETMNLVMFQPNLEAPGALQTVVINSIAQPVFQFYQTHWESERDKIRTQLPGEEWLARVHACLYGLVHL